MSSRLTARTGRPSRGGDRTRRRILASALRLFARNGFHATSIRGLARSVGLTEAAIYYHFPSKRAIIEALYEERGFMSAMEELEQLPGELPLPQQLIANALASARLWDDNTDLLRMVILEVLRGDRAAQAVHRELMERWRQGIRRLLRCYQQRGDIAPAADIDRAADDWVNLMFGTFMDRLLTLGRSPRRFRFLTPDLRRQAEETASRFAQGLTGAASSVPASDVPG